MSEPLSVSDIVIPREEFGRLYQLSRKRQQGQEARRKTVGRIKDGVIVALLLATVGEGYALATVVAKSEYVPVFVYQRDDGTVTNSMQWAALPEATRSSSEVNTLWTFVRLWETYSSPEAEYAWNVVSAMSTKDLRDAYQAWQDDKKAGPRAIYGEAGQVKVAYVSHAPVCKGECPEHPDTYLFRFDRQEKVGTGGWSAPVRYSVQLRFRYARKLPWWLIATADSPGLIVWEYPGSRPEGIAR